ncbi:MAG: bile acid:sodium symporter family protein [Deltaproteobacteria bacterium]|nr:MAG: bile acid:sodium symporter family protein [Deltaproteobacteria bacterium]
MTPDIDTLVLDFDAGSLLALNVILALIMFGVALSLEVEDFRRVAHRPRAPLVALSAQFILLPALTWVLTLVLAVPPSVALGMILVSTCPGGNMSNFFTLLGRGNTALSVTVTAVGTLLAIVMTPLNVTFWGGLSADTRAVLTSLHVNPMDMVTTVLLVVGLPLVLGMAIRHFRPRWADRVVRPFKVLGLVLFGLLLVVAFHANLDIFAVVIGVVFLPVLLHNAMAWGIGLGSATLARLPREDRRAIGTEVAIQNSGLGLVLIFAFFDGLGGMAVVAAWWGIWHIVAGMAVAGWWSRTPPLRGAPPCAE